MIEERAKKTAELRKRIAELENQVQAKSHALIIASTWFYVDSKSYSREGKTERAETNRIHADYCRMNAE